MDVPEDIREKAKEVRDLMWIHSSPRFAADAIAQAILAERLAQRERDAKIAVGFDDGDPQSGFSQAAGTIARLIRQS